MKHLSVNRFIISTILFLVLAAHSESVALEQTLTPSNSLQPADKIEIYVRWTDKEITIDGKLNEEAWNDALPYEDYFFQLQPEDRAPSSEKTRVMVLQNDKTIYFGIHCYDSEPEKIFATSMRRDQNYGSGEVIELLLDTFQDNRNCYAFDTNPLGGKGDAIISDQGNHINKQWDCVIDMTGARNDAGWSAEFAIPFKSLKYREGEVVDWNINITREIKHRYEETYIVPIPRELGHNAKFRGEMFALLRGIRPPKRGLHFQIYPYLLAGRTQVFGESRQKKDELNSGVDVKYDFTPQLALDLTYHTDFAQVEAEEEIVNVTRFNILRQEKRDFFLQNAGFFQFGPGSRVQSNFMLFDSRTIGILDRRRLPLIGGGKLSGRIGRYSVGMLSLQSERTMLQDDEQPSTNYTIVRLKRDIAKNSHLGLMALNQQTTGSRYSRALGVDGIWNASQAVRFDASTARSFAPDVSSDQMAGDFGFVLNKDWIDVQLRYTYVDSLFNPQMAFVLRPDIRSTNGAVTLTQWLNNRLLQNMAFSSGLVYTTDPQHTLLTRENSYTASLLLRRSDRINASVINSYEFVPRESRIRDLTISRGVYETWRQSLSFNSYRARPITANVNLTWGELFDGTQTAISVTGTAKVTNHLAADLAYSHNRIDLGSGSLAATVLSTRWTYSFSPDFFAKAYLQWNSADDRFSANILIDYAYRPRSHIYLVYNENQNTLLQQPTDRIIMLKLTYLWQP